MNKLFTYSLWAMCGLFFCACSFDSGHFKQVTIKVNASNVPADSAVYLEGNLPQLKYWQEPGLRMELDEQGLWSATIPVEKDYPLEYKITLGTWKCEAVSKSGKRFDNFKIRVQTDTSAFHKIHNWLCNIEEKPLITGDFEIHKEFESKLIPPRDVLVWLPPGYAEAEERYPVLYMHDGQQIMDPNTSTWNKDWGVDETLDSLIRNEVIPPMIVVGVNCTQNRSNEYGMGEMGENYMDFLIEELKPFIDENYRSLTTRDNTWVGGASMGGLISFRLVWERSQHFSRAICMSPAFVYQEYDYIPQMVAAGEPQTATKIYVDNGDQDLDTLLMPGYDAMIEQLEKTQVTFTNLVAEGATHNEEAWAKRFPEALKFIVLPQE